MAHDLIDENGNYEPSKLAKNLWLFTRKKPFHIENDLEFYGLFQTYGYKKDAFLVLIALILESYGTYALIAVLPIWYFGLIGFFVDFVLAIVAHLFIKGILLRKNKILLLENGNNSFLPNVSPAYNIKKYKTRIFWYNCFSWFFYIFIILLGVGKVLAIIQYAPEISESTGLIVFYSILYAISALIQITVTGYWLFEFVFRTIIKREKNKIAKSREDLRMEDTNYITQLRRKEMLGLNLREGEYGKSSVRNNIFWSWGILQDDLLKSVVDLQDMTQRRKTSIQLLHFQIQTLLTSDAYRIPLDLNENIEQNDK